MSEHRAAREAARLTREQRMARERVAALKEVAADLRSEHERLVLDYRTFRAGFAEFLRFNTQMTLDNVSLRKRNEAAVAWKKLSDVYAEIKALKPFLGDDHVPSGATGALCMVARRLRNGSDWSSLALVDKTRREILAAVEIVLERGGEVRE